jgi:hypothetical protein
MQIQKKKHSHDNFLLIAALLCLYLISWYCESHFLPQQSVLEMPETDSFRSVDPSYRSFLDDLNSNFVDPGFPDGDYLEQ